MIGDNMTFYAISLLENIYINMSYFHCGNYCIIWLLCDAGMARQLLLNLPNRHPRGDICMVYLYIFVSTNHNLCLPHLALRCISYLAILEHADCNEIVTFLFSYHGTYLYQYVYIVTSWVRLQNYWPFVMGLGWSGVYPLLLGALRCALLLA